MSWEVVRRLVRGCFEDILGTLTESMLRSEENLFVRAVAGRWGNAYARLERIAVTTLGNYAPQIFSVFFDGVEQLEKPFDFIGTLRRSGTVFSVKAVTGDQAFNSTLQQRIKEVSFTLRNPRILTLQGALFGYRVVGRALWLDPHRSWLLVTGDPSAYKTFRDIVFEEARPYREKVFKLIGDVARKSGN